MLLACNTQATALERMLSTICLGIFSKYLSVGSSTPTVEDCFALYRCHSGAVVSHYLHGLKLRYSVNGGICFGRDSSTQTSGGYDKPRDATKHSRRCLEFSTEIPKPPSSSDGTITCAERWGVELQQFPHCGG